VDRRRSANIAVGFRDLLRRVEVDVSGPRVDVASPFALQSVVRVRRGAEAAGDNNASGMAKASARVQRSLANEG
jgi:hypothetical protein